MPIYSICLHHGTIAVEGEMFGFLGRKRRERERLFAELLIAAQQGDFRRHLIDLAKKQGIVVAPDSKDEGLASRVAALVVREAATRNGWDIKELNEAQKVAMMLILFVACDYLSQQTGTSFELLTVLAPVIVFGATEEVAELTANTGEEFNRLATDPQGSRVIIAIGKGIAAWVASEDPDEMSKLAQTLQTISKSVA